MSLAETKFSGQCKVICTKIDNNEYIVVNNLQYVGQLPAIQRFLENCRDYNSIRETIKYNIKKLDFTNHKYHVYFTGILHEDYRVFEESGMTVTESDDSIQITECLIYEEKYA